MAHGRRPSFDCRWPDRRSGRSGGQPIAQIAGAVLGGGYGGVQGSTQRLAVQLRIAEEEELVFDYSAANRSAKLIRPVYRVAVGKGVSGEVREPRGVHLQVLKRIPMEIVGAGFGRVAGNAATRV